MLKFSDIPYSRPDIEAVKQELKAIIEAFTAAGTYAAAREQFVAADRLMRHLNTVVTVAEIRHSIDTRDAFYDEEVNYWNRTTPELQEYLDLWTRALCASPFRGELSGEFGEVVFLNAELALKCFDVSIIPLLQEENDLTTKYDKLIASAQIPFRGGVYTVAQLGPFKNDADDAIRREAWIVEGGWYRENKPELDAIYDRLTAIRHEMSQKLRLRDFVELGYYRMSRNCYDSADIARFRE
ncbi:MAG: M3 family oligoendopeptidase, partial [Oscillospiraceae bacterium]|nr:M3 family oligoendopeptidase [Oscillospiraceae bacterium]